MNTDPLFVNKIVGAILFAGLLAMVTGFVSKGLYSPDIPAKQAYVIAVPDKPAAATQAAAAPAGPEAVAGLLAAASTENGKKLTKKCAACHTFNKRGKNKIGPALWDVVGRDKAAVAGFKYSPALKGLGGAWSYEDLNKFIFKPKAFLKDTRMVFAGFKKAKDRADMIAYLRSLSDSPKPLP
jgi:cytochrome c